MKTIIQAFLVLLALTVITGVVYPLAVTVAAQLFFNDQANGSTVMHDGRIIGSSLIGQPFISSKYFRPRPSATGYSAMPSGGSNVSPASNSLRDSVAARRAAFRQLNGLEPASSVPLEMLFASGSGLDPEISVESARLQAHRVAAARGLSKVQTRKLDEAILQYSSSGLLGILKSDRVNTVLLNCALDSLAGIPE